MLLEKALRMGGRFEMGQRTATARWHEASELGWSQKRSHVVLAISLCASGGVTGAKYVLTPEHTAQSFRWSYDAPLGPPAYHQNAATSVHKIVEPNSVGHSFVLTAVAPAPVLSPEEKLRASRRNPLKGANGSGSQGRDLLRKLSRKIRCAATVDTISPPQERLPVSCPGHFIGAVATQAAGSGNSVTTVTTMPRALQSDSVLTSTASRAGGIADISPRDTKESEASDRGIAPPTGPRLQASAAVEKDGEFRSDPVVALPDASPVRALGAGVLFPEAGDPEPATSVHPSEYAEPSFVSSSQSIGSPRQVEDGVEFEVSTQINGLPAGRLSVLIAGSDIRHPEYLADNFSVRLADVIVILKPVMDEKLFDNLSSADASRSYVTFSQLRSHGISVSFDHHDRLIFKAI